MSKLFLQGIKRFIAHEIKLKLREDSISEAVDIYSKLFSTSVFISCASARDQETTSDEQKLSAVLSLTRQHTLTHTRTSEGNHNVTSILKCACCITSSFGTKIKSIISSVMKNYNCPMLCLWILSKQIMSKYELDHIFFSVPGKTQVQER